MPTELKHRVGLAALSLLFAVACAPVPNTSVSGKPKATGKSSAASRIAATAKPVTAPHIAVLSAELVGKARLTGKVKLIAKNGGSVISNNSGGIISNNAGSLVSDQGMGLVGNNAAGVIANNAAGFQATGRDTYRLMALGEAALAEARIEVLDAAGKPLLGPDGQAIATTTDATGTYILDTPLPDNQNVVLRIKLWNGGELSALLPKTTRERREQPIDTATSLGAAFILNELVKGSQETYDRLPEAEAERLRTDLAATANLWTAVPTYKSDELVALTKELRSQAPAVDKTLADIKALLLGQARLGSGKLVTEVPLTDVRALAPDGAGGYYMIESLPGRLRHVAPDGTLSTYADSLAGQIKENIFGAVDMVRTPDNTFFLASRVLSTIERLSPDGKRKTIVGTGEAGHGPTGSQGTAFATRPYSVALAKDGTLFFGEDADPGPERAACRVLSLGADGVVREPVQGPVEWQGQGIMALAQAPDETWYASVGSRQTLGNVYRLKPGATAWERLSWEVHVGAQSDLAIAKDGGVLVTEDDGGRIVRFAPDNTRTVLSDVKTGSPIHRPTELFELQAGGFRVIDHDQAKIYDLGMDGQAKLVGGIALATSTTDTIALNSPLGAAISPNGALYLVEIGSSTVQRWTGSELVPVAGGVRGDDGDGGPAASAQLRDPEAIAFNGKDLIILDRGNGKLRKIDEANTISSLTQRGSASRLAPGTTAEAHELTLQGGSALAVGAGGHIYFGNLSTHQVLAFGPDGKFRQVAGDAKGSTGDGGLASAAALNTPVGLAVGPDGALYIADTGNMRVRRIRNPDKPEAAIEAFAGKNGLEAIVALRPDAWPDTTRSEAVFAFPAGLCFDKTGNLYVSELGTIALPLLTSFGPGVRDLPLASLPKVPARVRKIAPDGTVTTVAGPGGKFFADPTAADALLLPMGLTVDAAGRLVIVDAGTNQVRLLPAGSF